MKRKLQGICYTNSACSLWRKSSSRGYALILREMLYDIPLCPENQGRFMERRLDAEWEEKLYEYAEEALAIWEEYEALTGEQQTQISEEELEKLTVWVELAETLSDNEVMLADYSEHHGEDDWTALSADTTEESTLSGGKYYLSDNDGDKNIAMGTISIDGDVTLCLNGQTLTHSGDTGSVIVVNSGTFTLCDCENDTGCITGGKGVLEGNSSYGGGIYICRGAQFIMLGGTIRGNTAQFGGGISIGQSGTNAGTYFTMSGGVIEDNTASSQGGATDTTVQANNILLAEGENTVKVNVTEGDASKVYIVTITREAPAGNPVNITTCKDGDVWTGEGAPSATDYKLTSDGGSTFLPGLAVPDGTYKIYIGETIDTGVEVTVAGAETSAKVDYYTVTFYDGTTELTAPAQQIVLKGAAASMPTDNPTKTGYTFSKWVTADGGSTGYDFANETVTGKTSVYAKWTPQNYQVSFEYYGADGGDTTASKNVTYDSKYGDLPVPTRTGYTFKGWYTEADGQGSEVNAGTVVKETSAHTLHAYWKDETAPDKPVLQDGVTLPTGWTNNQTTIPLKLYDGVGVTELWVSIDGKGYTKVDGFTPGTGSMTYNYTPVLEGEREPGKGHTYQFKAVDAAGNFAESDTFTVKLDQTKPMIGTLTYENEVHLSLWHWIIGKKSMIIHVPVTDTGSGVTGISCTLTPRDADGNLDESKAAEKKAAVKDGEAKITFDKDFRGTITINCTDAAGNKAESVTVGANAGGVIVEDTAPDITTDAKTDYYDTPTEIHVTVKDDIQNAITAGIAAVKYKVEDGMEQSVTVNTSALQAQVTFTIPASEISTGITQITVTATDNAGNEAAKRFTVKVRGPEKQPAAKIDYREEKLTKLVPGEKYTIDGTEYTADGEGCIPIKEDWFNSTVDIVKKGTGSETTDSPAQSLPIPARPAAPGAPKLSVRDDESITLKTIPNAQYRLSDGTQNWQESTAFTGLDQKTVYKFRAYYPATDTSFASLESDEAQIATMPTAPTPDKLKISYTAETLTLTDGIEAFTDKNCTTPVTAGSVEIYMGQTLYIRYPANGIIPESLTTAVPIPARPAKPAPATEDASYPTATDGAITDLTSDKTYEYRVKNKDDGFSEWKEAVLNGTRIENLPAGEYEVRVKAVEAEGNASFQSEAAAVTIGEKPAAKHETPDIRIDYTAETLTGFVPGAEYMINGETITADVDGIIKIETGWFGTTLPIIRKGNGKDKLDSDAQSLPILARPAKPTPTGVDVSTAGGAGKLTGLTAGVTYEVSADGAKTWVSQTADGSGEITGLAPGSYTVRVKAGAASFASENSAPAEIGAYKVKVTFMVNGEKYKEIILDYGTTLTDIPAVPAKENAIGAWCMDGQGTPAVFANITADMTVYAVYTSVYTVTLQTGTGYTLSAETGSKSPVKEGGSFTLRFVLSKGYRKTSDFAVKVNGVKVELTADGTYTISNVRENKTVTVEGVAKKTGGKPSNSGGGDKEDDAPKPTPPSSEPSDNTPSTPPVKPPAEVTSPAPETTPPAAEKEPEGRKTETTPEKEENREQEEDEKTKEEQEPTGTDTKEQEPDSADAGQTEKEPQAEKREVQIGDGTVIVTVVCEEEKCTATVADTEKVVKAVLTPDQQESVNGGETIEIRIDVTDISNQVPRQDKEVIEGGIEAYREEVPGLVLGMYVDISLFIRIGTGDWDAITETKEPIEVAVGIPKELQSGGREFYIIRAHNGEYTFMNDLDDAPDTITVSTDLFSSYAIAYVETDETGTDDGAECGLCHICPTFLGICCFIWLAVIIALALIIYIIWRKKRQKEEKREK